MDQATAERDELRAELAELNDSVIWLRAELRALSRLHPKPKVYRVLVAATALGAVLSWWLL